MPSPAPPFPSIGSGDGGWLWTLFVCSTSSHSAPALAAVRRLREHGLSDRDELRIHDIHSDPAAAVAAGVLAVPCLVGRPPPQPGQALADQAGQAALQRHMDQPEVALAAITSGTADALLVGTNDPAGGGAGFLLPDSAADPYRATPYRVIVEQMGAGVGTLSADGLLLYANPRLGELLDRPCKTLLGRPLAELIPASQRACLERLRKVSPGRTERAELELLPDTGGDAVRVLVAVSGLRGTGNATQCLIVTDLSGLQTSGIAPACDDQRYLFLAEAVSAFVMETDGQRRVRWVSPSVHAVLGWMPQELVGACLTDLLHPEETLEPEPPTGQRQRLLRLRTRDGTDRWMRLRSWPLKGEGRISCHWIIGFQDVSELVAEQQARAIDQARLAAVLVRSAAALSLQRLQQTTGLVSRAELLEELSRLHPPAHRRTRPLALARCHLRNLREIHEGQGSESAERVLLTIEQRLRQVLRDDAIVTRVNVDQLLVVLGGMDNHAQAEATAESMRVVVGLPLPIPDAAIRITLWVDVALEQPGERMEDLISSALQQAWASGPLRLDAIATH